MRRIGLIILTGLVLAGCGDGEQQVRATLDADYKAGDRQDWKAMCALRTEAGRQALPMCAPTPPENQPVFTFMVGTNPAAAVDVDVDGDRATARYADDSATHLRKVDDQWLIDADDEELIHATLNAHEQASLGGDLLSACALMTDAAQRELLRHNPSGCGAAATPRPNEFGVTQAEFVQEVQGELKRVEIDGDTAKVHYDRSVTTLRKVDGRWLID